MSKWAKEDFPVTSVLYDFKDYLKKEFEKVLRRNSDRADPDPVEISHIHLSFDHRELFEQLEERGTAIKNSDDEKVERIENEIIGYLGEHERTACIPKEAYITFENEEGVQRAINASKKGEKVIWRNTELSFKTSDEPSNIEFANKFQSSFSLALKKILVLAACLGFLLFICYIIFIIMDFINRLGRIYPLVDCGDVLKESSHEMMENYAMIEYFNFVNSDQSEESFLKINTDNLQCYCDNLREKTSFLHAYEKEFNITVFGHEVVGEVCNDYLWSSLFIEAMDYIIPLLIFTTDFMLEFFACFCIAWIAYENKTHEISRIQLAVFGMTFFNNALAILLINARFTNKIKGTFLFDGMYTDFSDDWYDKSSEYFVTPMFMEVLTPFTDFLLYFGIQKVFALLDRRFNSYNKFKTKSQTASDYAELNSGLENELSTKYAQILGIAMVACFYGFGLPLIPITVLICLSASFIFEKIMLFLHFRKPPLYDETLNKTSVFILKWGAFLYVAIAYWMLTNKQMFDNVLDPIAYKDEIEDYHHHIFELPDGLHQKILLFYTICLFGFLFLYDICRDPIGLLFHKDPKKLTKEVEDLTPFRSSIRTKDKLHLYSEEKERREKHGYKVLFDDLYDDMDEILSEKTRLNPRKQMSVGDPNIRYITDAISYDTLDSIEHSLKYSYVPVSKRRKGHDTINLSSKFTRLVFEYPYHKDLGLLKKLRKMEVDE